MTFAVAKNIRLGYGPRYQYVVSGLDCPRCGEPCRTGVDEMPEPCCVHELTCSCELTRAEDAALEARACRAILTTLGAP